MQCTSLFLFRHNQTWEIYTDADGRDLPKLKKFIKVDWWLWDKMDDINRRVCPLAWGLNRGLSDQYLCSAFYYIRLLHCGGLPIRMVDIRR
jgi:hypothetical protein